MEEIELHADGDLNDNCDKDSNSNLFEDATARSKAHQVQSISPPHYETVKPLCIGNLTWWTTDKCLIDKMKRCGISDVINIRFYENKINGQSKGFCVVEFASEQSVETVMKNLPSVKIHGQYPIVTACNRQNLAYFLMQSQKLSRPDGSTEKMFHNWDPGDYDKNFVNRPTKSHHNNPTDYYRKPTFQSSQIIHSQAKFQSSNSWVPPCQLNSTTPPFSRLPSVAKPCSFSKSLPPRPLSGSIPPAFPPSIPQRTVLPDTRYPPPPLPKWQTQSGACCKGLLTANQTSFNVPNPHGNIPFGNQTSPLGLAPPKYSGQNPPNQHLLESKTSVPSYDVEKMLKQNRKVCSNAICHSISRAGTGEYGAAIETLTTALSLIEQSKICTDERCEILMGTLRDMLHSMKSKSHRSYSQGVTQSTNRSFERSRRDKQRDRSSSRERGRSWNRNRSRDRRSRSWNREHDRSKSRDSGKSRQSHH